MAPSTSFSGQSAAQTRCSSICLGSGRSSRQPWIKGSELIVSSNAMTASVLLSAGRTKLRLRMSAFSQERRAERS